MAYLGNKPVNNFVSFAKQDITGNGGTSYSLDYPVTGANDIDLYINNVRQEPTEAYSCSGSTLTLTEAVSSSDDVYAIFRGRALQTVSHPSDAALEASQATISGDLTVDTNTLHVDSSTNNVGIGTVTPDIALTVEKSKAGNFIAKFQNTNSSTPYGVWVKDAPSAANNYPLLQATDSAGTGTYFKIMSGTGYVTTPYQPAFLAHGNNSSYIPISTLGGAGSYIPFTNAVTNIGNHYNSSSYRFTAPIAGMYHFHCAVYTRTGSATEDIYTRWRVNDSSNKGYAYFYNTTGTEIHNTITDSINIYLNANDFIGVTINGNANSDIYTGFQELRFSGYLIG